MVKQILIALLMILLTAWSAVAGDGTPEKQVVHQLRIYEIFEHNKQGFHERFRDHATRIMARHGFKIVSTWESKFEGRTEFVYLIEWPDRATMKAQWASFMKDEEWIAIKKRTAEAHGPLVGQIQDRTLEATEYSPRKSFFP